MKGYKLILSMNAEYNFEVPIIAILCDGRDFFFYKYEANMQDGSALPIFARRTFSKNTKFSVPDSTYRADS